MRPDLERQYRDFVALRAGALVRFGYLLCGDWHRAEDAVQTGLTKLYLVWHRLDRRESVDAYVRRVIVRVLADEGRLARFRRERLSDRVPEPPPVVGPVDAAGERLAISYALGRLAPRQRAVLVLRFWEDLGVEQVAEILGCSVGTVKSQTARGLATLRRLLARDFPSTTGRF